jgi:hypothetical protein
MIDTKNKGMIAYPIQRYQCGILSNDQGLYAKKRAPIIAAILILVLSHWLVLMASFLNNSKKEK